MAVLEHYRASTKRQEASPASMNFNTQMITNFFMGDNTEFPATLRIASRPYRCTTASALQKHHLATSTNACSLHGTEMVYDITKCTIMRQNVDPFSNEKSFTF